MSEITTKSGAKVAINIARWEDAKKLKAAILRELADAGIKLDTEADIQTLLPAVLKVDSSEAVDTALWPCLIKCTRDSAKITSATFDSEEGRGDYYEIVWECIMVNLRPLVESLMSVLPASIRAQIAAANLPKTAENSLNTPSPTK